MLEGFGVPRSALIAEGGESRVYGLDRDRILRLLRTPLAPDAIARKRAFLEAIDGRLPFTTPLIEAIAADGSWTVERRIPGASLLARLATLAGRERAEALRNYAEAAGAIAAIRLPESPYGLVLADAPAATWHAHLRQGLDRFIAANGAAIAALRGDLPDLKARALDLLGSVAERPPKALVHGDYFPGNVLIGDDLRVTGLVDFSVWTAVGDPLYDVISAAIFPEMLTEATAADIALVRDAILARHGSAATEPAPFYRAYFAFAMADPAGEHGPYPRLFAWARENLAALAAGGLAF